MLHQPYMGHNVDQLMGYVLSCFNMTLKSFRRSNWAGPGTAVQRTASSPGVTPSKVIYKHVDHCCSCVAEPFFDENQFQLE